MSKYTFINKRNVVAQYIYDNKSMSQISRESHIELTSIRQWIKLFKAQGINALKIKHSHRKYSSNFKLRVVDYYLSNTEGPSPVAAHFGINPSQVYHWKYLFNSYGIKGLKPSPKGRPSKVKHRRFKKNKQKLSLTEKEIYENKILHLKAKLHRYRLDHIVLKTLAQMKSERIKKRRKR